ncbi:MAG: hypothetical protein ABID61_01920 [Candidatus Micrarchaeota archaeon]
MKKIKQILISIFIGLFAVFVTYAANTFPTSENNWTDGDVIESDWANQLEYRIGATSTTSPSTITYQLDQLMGTTTLPNLSIIGTITTGVWNGTIIGDTYLTKTGDWTGTIDGNNFAGGAIGTGELLYGSSAGSIAELTISASSSVLVSDGSLPVWNTKLGSASIEDIYLLNTGDIGIGVFDFGGATSLEIPNGASPTVDIIGEMAIDSTSGQLIWYDGAKKRQTLAEYYPSMEISSSTLAYKGSYSATGTTTLSFKGKQRAITYTYFSCTTDQGTTTVQFGDGTNWSEFYYCGFDIPAEDTTITNGSFTATEKFQMQIGQQEGSPNSIQPTWTYEITTD